MFATLTTLRPFPDPGFDSAGLIGGGRDARWPAGDLGGNVGVRSVAGGCGDGHASGDDEVWVLQGLELFEWVAADADEVGGGAFDQLSERCEAEVFAGSCGCGR